MLRMLLATLGYCALAVTLTWPLARNLGGQLPGDPAGDTGVYVWNLWVVDHQLREGRSPLRTERIFAATGTADLSQHNTTLAPAVVASPLVGRFGVVTAFNLVYLGLLAGCGLGVYLLSEYLTGRSMESWLAGALTAASPCVLARSTEHLSLLALGIIPVFAYTWVRMLDGASSAVTGVIPGRAQHAAPLRRRGGHAVGFAIAAGVTIAVAAYCDPYLAIYSALLAAFLLAAQVAHVTFERRPFFGFGGDRRRVLDGLLVALVLVTVSILVTGGWTVTVLGAHVVAHTLYSPVLALTVLGTLRLAWWMPPRVSLQRDAPLRRYLSLGTLSLAAGTICLSPLLLALMHRMQSGRMVAPTIYWRSSPPGVDLAAFIAPSSTHPLWGGTVLEWLERLHPAGFAEYTPSLSLTALAIIGIAVAMRLPLPRRWLIVTVAGGACALGPFVHVWGINTFIPGPWALLRYVPVVEWARSPSRFALVVTIGVGVLCAHALVALRERLSVRAHRALVAGIVMLMVAEFWPTPRTMHAVSIPAIYSTIAADPDRSATVLELPVGMRDGTSSMGDFSARTQFFQTMHGKRLIGGYLSRISQRRKNEARNMPIFSALLALSERRPIDDAHRRRALGRREVFIARTGLRYVVIDTKRCPPALRQFADDLLHMERLGEGDGYELFRVTPAAQPSSTAHLGLADPVRR